MKILYYIAFCLLVSPIFAEATDDVLSVDGIQILPEPTRPKLPKPSFPKKAKKKPVVQPSPTPAPAPQPSPRPVTPPAEAKAVPPLPVAESRKVASVSLQESADTTRPARVNVTLGGTLGLNYAFPAVSVQFAVARQATVALMGIWYNNFSQTQKQTAVGALLLGEYFLGGENFKGISLRGGLGLYSLSAETDTGLQSTTPGAVLGTLNYHLMTQSGITLGLGVGFQYALSQRVAEIKFAGLLPLFTFDVGISFK